MSDESRQAQSMSTAHSRHLDHLIDIQEGCPFTAVPEPARSDFINGNMSPAKFRLLFTMLSHAANFKIKRAYLEKRFSAHSLTKYLKELEDEGYIRKDRVPMPNGGFENVYHTNRVQFWAQCPSVDPAVEHGSDTAEEHYRSSCNTALFEGRTFEGRIEQGLNESKDNENKTNQMNDDSNPRKDIADVGHHSLGEKKILPYRIEYSMKLQGLFSDDLAYRDYKALNSWVDASFEKYKDDEMTQFFEFTRMTLFVNNTRRGLRAPAFSLEAYKKMMALWQGSPEREIWSNPPDPDSDPFEEVSCRSRLGTQK